jgi:hypothetical protein
LNVQLLLLLYSLLVKFDRQLDSKITENRTKAYQPKLVVALLQLLDELIPLKQLILERFCCN